MKKFNVYNKEKCLIGTIEEKEVGYPSTCRVLQPSYYKEIFYTTIGDAIEHAETLGYGVEIDTDFVCHSKKQYRKYFRKNNPLAYNQVRNKIK